MTNANRTDSADSVGKAPEDVAALFAKLLAIVEEGLLVHVPGVLTYRNETSHDPLRDLNLSDGVEQARSRWFEQYQLFDEDGQCEILLGSGDGPVERALAGETIRRRLYRVRQVTTGLDRYYETTCRPFRVNDEGPLGFAITTLDLTERAFDSKRLAGSEHRQSRLLDLAAPASLIVDYQGKVYDRRDGGMAPIAEFDPQAEGEWASKYRLLDLSDQEECSFLETILWPVQRQETDQTGMFQILDRRSDRNWKVLVRGKSISAKEHGLELPTGDCTMLTFSPIEP